MLLLIFISLFTSILASELHINTTSGPVTGIYNNTAQTVRGFLGIPYAEPPIGNRRFYPPVPKTASNTIFNASSFPRSCPGQYTPSNESVWSVLPYLPWNTDDLSEDCLSINVWTPAKKHQKSGKAAAVMMYIYGGAFTQGGSAIAFTDGTNLVQDQEDVIVVTFNYRVSVFGYPNAPGLSAGKQNVGLLDQRLAVEWVHNNIANFGGDPSRIMLFGQSAGATSVDMYSYAYPKNPLVHALGMESGATATIYSDDIAQKNWTKLSSTLGCGSNGSSIECMQKLPFEKILSTINAGSYQFEAVQDNVTVFFDYEERTKMGAIAKLPTLMGVNQRETAAYFPLNSTSVNETQIFANTQSFFNCPVHESALLRLDQNIPTWRYLYHGNWSDLTPSPWLGAYHSSEIPIVFGTYNSSNLDIPASSQEIQASKYIQDAWVAFAKDPENGLLEYGWPRFDPNNNTLINLALNNSATASFSSAKDWDSHCEGSSFVA